MPECPYCGKNYKRPGFWLDNHIMIKHRKNFQIKIFILDAFIVLILGIFINSVFHYGYVDKLVGRETDREILKEILEEVRKEDIRLDIRAEENCVSDIREFTWEKKGFRLIARLYDGCDVDGKSLKQTISEKGYFAFLVYPLWNADEKDTHYFFDYFDGENTDTNRISIYKSIDGFLVFKIYNSKGIPHNVTIDVEDWKFEEWTFIAWSFNEETREVLLHYYNFDTGRTSTATGIFEELDLEIRDAIGYVGSDVSGKNQADAVISKVPDWIISKKGEISGSLPELIPYLGP